jgi:hypothetical protein
METGWNLVGKKWYYYDGYAIIMEEDASHEDDINYGSEDEWDTHSDSSGFRKYLASFRYDKETGFYYDAESGAAVGDEEQMYEDYEHWRYESHWARKSTRSLFEDWD